MYKNNIIEQIMFTDPHKIPFEFPVPIWSYSVGQTIKEMCEKNVIKTLYFDEDGYIQVIPNNTLDDF